MSVADPTEPVRTRAEIAAAIRALSPAQWARLRAIAGHYHALGCPMEAKDLLQEAFRRALDERNCPVSVDIVRFLDLAMRSIRDGELKRVKRRPILVSPSPAGGEPPAPDRSTRRPTPRSGSRRPTKTAPASASARRSSSFSPTILPRKSSSKACMEGMRGEDLRALTDLDPTAYQSKRRLIRRRIEKAIQGMSK